MKVFQDIRTAIDSWEEDRSLILKIQSKLNCEKSEIWGKIDQLQEARPASDLNKINERMDELMDNLNNAMGKAEDTESSFDRAFSEMEYVDASDTVATIQDVQDELEGLSSQIKSELKGEKE